MAVEDINRAGTIYGRQLNHLEYRTGSYFVDARYAADLATTSGAVAIVGSNSSSLSMEIAERAEAVGVVQISNVSTAEDLTWDPISGRDRPFVFRVCGPDVEIGALLADFVRDHLRARRVAVLFEIGRTYSAKLARVFIAAFQDPAVRRLTREFPYIPLETDFRPHLRRVAAFAPDAVFIPGSFADATLIAAQARSVDLRATWVGADGWSNPLLFSRGGPPGDAYYGDLCSTPESFRRRYHARFGEEPDGCRAILAHDAVLVLAAALRSLGPLSDQDLTRDLDRTRRRLRAAVATSSVPADTGPVRFDEHGDIRRGIAVVQVRRVGEHRIDRQVHAWYGER